MVYNIVKIRNKEEMSVSKEKWLNKPDLDESLRVSLNNYNEEESYDAFYTRLEFGTAGMRGLLGAGPNRLNTYTVGRANIGYGKYLLTLGHHDPKVAIAYDNRHYSREFADACAKLLAQLGIKSYVFETLRPTPELSFAVRELGCVGGIVITASHNPKEYNGYKVYDETGCQLVDSKIAKVIKYVNEIEDETKIDVN
jgi:phosphoglucomutase